MSRRNLFRLAAASIVVTGCRGTQPPADARPPEPPASPSRARPTPTPDLVPAARYVPLAGEPVPDAKQVASDFVQALTTHRPGQRPEDALATVAGLTGIRFVSAAALRAAAPLFAEQESVGRIVYPQVGGLIPLGPGAQRACIMVVVEQESRTRGGARVKTVRACDVRLRVEQGVWRIDELVAAGGEPVERPDGLDPRVTRALDNARLELPDSARWDVHAGRISPELLAVLDAGTAGAVLSVAVLSTGHPENVFGTKRTSDHTVGRAADVWRVAGTPVVTSGAAAGPTRAALEAFAADRRVKQTGSPVGSDLDGPGRRRSFTDLVHRDHLHVAVGAVPAQG